MIKKICFSVATHHSCNAHCVCCGHIKDGIIMSDNIWDNFLSHIESLSQTNPKLLKIGDLNIDLSSCSICFGWREEPLLDNKLFDRINTLSKMKNINRVFIVSNASLLDYAFINNLLKINKNDFVMLLMSIINPIEDEYEKETGLSFNTVINNIKRAFVLSSITKKFQCEINASLNSQKFKKHKEIFKNIFSKQLYNKINFAEQNAELWENSTLQNYKKNTKDVYCEFGVLNFYLSANGDISLCCLKELTIIGNINNINNFKEFLIDIIHKKATGDFYECKYNCFNKESI